MISPLESLGVGVYEGLSTIICSELLEAEFEDMYGEWENEFLGESLLVNIVPSDLPNELPGAVVDVAVVALVAAALGIVVGVAVAALVAEAEAPGVAEVEAAKGPLSPTEGLLSLAEAVV